MQYRTKEFFGNAGQFKNASLVFTDPTSQKPFMAIVVDTCPDMHLVGAAAGSVTVPRSLDAKEQSADNITDWALNQFRSHYETTRAFPDKIDHILSWSGMQRTLIGRSWSETKRWPRINYRRCTPLASENMRQSCEAWT
jgi:hypothetical protein